jgi:hypothetical protein
MGLHYDIREPSTDVGQQASATAWRVLLEAMAAIFDQQTTATRLDFERAVLQAQSAAIKVWGQEIERGSMFAPRFWLIPLYAGMTDEDWRRMRDDALQITRREEDRIRRLAEEMLEAGQSANSVAHLFGYSAPKVQSWRRRLLSQRQSARNPENSRRDSSG